MPSRAARICPRCRNPINGQRCDICNARTLRTLSLRTPSRDNPYARSKAWQAFSRTYLRAHPHCECEECNRLAPLQRPRSQLVDHIDGLGLFGPRAFDPENCMAMTRRCHARKSIRHDGALGKPIRRKSTT